MHSSASSAAPLDEIKRLFSPLSPDVFFSSHWDKEAVCVKGQPNKFEWLGLEPSFHLRLGREIGRSKIKAAYKINEQVHHEMRGIEPLQLKNYVDAGMTLCLENVQESDSRLKSLASAMRRYLCRPGDVTIHCYVSPDKGGFAIHFDSIPVFVLQIEGRKRWRYSKTMAVRHPPTNFSVHQTTYAEHYPWAQVTVPKLEDLSETILEPGDMLYLPPGCWHRAFGQGYSIALSMSPTKIRFAELLSQWLEDRMIKEELWRQACPTAIGVGPQGNMPEQVRDWMSGNIQSFKNLVRDLTPDKIEALWRTWIASDDIATPMEAGEQESDPVSRQQRLQVHSPITYAMDVNETGDDIIRIFCMNRTIDMDLAGEEFIRRLSKMTSFVAEEAMTWSGSPEGYSWEEIQDVLTTLLQGGFLRRSDARPG